MAKIARIVMYLVDPNGEKLDSIKDSVEHFIDGSDCYAPIEIECEEKSFGWNDDLRINSIGVTKDEVSKFFREL